MTQTCLILSDANANYTALYDTMQAHQQISPIPYEIQLVKAAELKNGLLDECQPAETTLLIPGAPSAMPYYKGIGEDGMGKIVNAVEAGMIYVGLCAGAYLAAALEPASYYQYIKSPADLNGLKRRQMDFKLPLLPLHSWGPALEFAALPEDKLTDDHIFGTANITFSGGTTMKALYMAGPVYENVTESANTQVLARYNDLNNCPAAIVKVKRGQGWAIGSGIHPEYTSAQIQARYPCDPGLQAVRAAYEDVNTTIADNSDQNAALFKLLMESALTR